MRFLFLPTLTRSEFGMRRAHGLMLVLLLVLGDDDDRANVLVLSLQTQVLLFPWQVIVGQKGR